MLLSPYFLAIQAKAETPKRFTRVFGWTSLNDEATAIKLKALGVTDVTADTPAQIALAKKYGFKAYPKFGPHGTRVQKISPEELQLQKKLNGLTLPPLPKDATYDEKAKRIEQIAKIDNDLKAQFGGEPAVDAPEGDVLLEQIKCFASDKNYEQSKAVLKRLSSLEGVDGICFDYIGYVNYKGCYCDDCLALYQEYLTDSKCEDNEKSRQAFYLGQIVDYTNAMVDYVKSLNPKLKIMSHVYPVFLAEPLYGNRLKIDYCGQTAAWFFLWDQKKISDYSKIITSEQNNYFPNVKGIPFLGCYYSCPSFPNKTPERIELELKAILEGGSEYLMVHSMDDVVKNPEVAAVFKKYCNP